MQGIKKILEPQIKDHIKNEQLNRDHPEAVQMVNTHVEMPTPMTTGEKQIKKCVIPSYPDIMAVAKTSSRNKCG